MIIASDFPYPPNHGGRVDIYERILKLKELNFDITLIATLKKNEKKINILHMKKFCSQIFIVNRKKSLSSLFSIVPYQVMSRINKEEIKNLKKNINGMSFDYVILEGHYTIGLYEQLMNNVNAKKIYLRIHNNESIYFKQLASSTNSFLKKIFYYMESFKFFHYEAKFLKKNYISGCLHISYDEYVNYKQKFPRVKHRFLPASLNIRDLKPYRKKNSKIVLFIGSLFMPNNIEGLQWYLEKIHQNILNNIPNYKLIIAGNTKGMNVKKFLKYLGNFSNVEFIDSPADLDFLYQKAEIFINPMLSGAGVKLKTINALKYGLPVVSTTKGSEGTGLINDQHVIIANNPEDFQKGIIRLFQNDELKKKLVINSQKYLEKIYDLKKNLLCILEN